MNNEKKTISWFVRRRFLPASLLVGLGALFASIGSLSVVGQKTYDFLRNAPRTGSIQIEIVDGSRQPMPAGTEILVRVIDGNQKQVLVKYFRASSITVDNLQFHDNFADRYSVIVWANGYKQAGFHPLNLERGKTVSVHLMLLPDDYELNFDDAAFDSIKLRLPAFHALISHGLSDVEARMRYEKLMLEQPLHLANLLNVATILDSLALPSGKSILPFYQKLVFDESLGQDRFFAYVDRRLVLELRQAVASGSFEYAVGADVFHKGQTVSFKEIDFWEANVQITFYENDTVIVDGVELVRVDTDIDYYRDRAAHILLEVIPNTLGGRMTDPLVAYQLRFIASRSPQNKAGRLVFDPPYTVEKKR